MVTLVTGAAGFIGSLLVERLLADRRTVVGIDCFRDYYDPAAKRNNIAASLRNPRFTLLEADLSGGFEPALQGCIPRGECVTVYHLAAQPGVRRSWGADFGDYVRDNVTATQKLLEWASGSGCVTRFVNASSSSVYGASPKSPFSEAGSLPAPVSPYGVTKLASEHLVGLYAGRSGIPSVSFRFFTVYGPRQRPDMAFHRFILAVLRGEPVQVLGDGGQTRDFTFVSDVVEGLYRAGDSPVCGVYNLGGGNRVTLLEAVGEIENATGAKAVLSFAPAQPGDARDTLADTTLLERDLGWKPGVPLREGIRRETEWIRAAYGL